MNPFLAYVATLSDPLTSTARRVSTERAVVEELGRGWHGAPLWFATVTWTMVQALPADDQWRQIAVRLPNGMSAPGSSAEPELVGAWLSGRPFGTVADHRDLIPPTVANPDEDLAFIHATDLAWASSYVLAAASEGLTETAAAAHQVTGLPADEAGYEIPEDWQALYGTSQGVAAVWLLSSAMRQAAARYRCYAGDVAVTAELPQLAFETVTWVDSLPLPDAANSPVDWASIVNTEQPPGLHGPRIPDNAYEKFRLV